MESELPAGLYETLVTELLAERLARLDDDLVHRGALRSADAGDRLGLHVGQLVARAVDRLGDGERVQQGLALTRELVEHLAERVRAADLEHLRPVLERSVLHAIRTRRPDGGPDNVAEPLIPLLDTTLLTNAPGEPNVGSQLRAEVDSADRIDVVMAFVRRTGINPMLEVLRAHCSRGRQLRVLTTTYTRSTEAAALDVLAGLGADVRVSYDTTSTRLHAKAWLFHRNSSNSTAYVGSSNLTHSAQVTGLEWNVRLSEARNRDVVHKVAAVFESYWHGGDFVPYEADAFRAFVAQPEPEADPLPPTELRAEPFQDRLLEQLELSRRRGHHRNLLAAATGTGKTVMAAIDYARLRARLPRARLLFVAHREEILDQSRKTFRVALRQASFGEFWVGGERPKAFEHVFASIQSLNAAKIDALDPEHFDVVIVDEFHHAAAPSYEKILARLRPKELLGLTATPERSDGLPVLQWFDDRIAAELRLWDAIDQQRLSPFAYFGIHDGLDLSDVPWRRGRGYDVDALTNLYTADDVWARRVIAEVRRHVGDIGAMRALGFCVSVDHARFMARVFNANGIAATAVWADTPAAERHRALDDLRAGELDVVFSVDLFNEGVDVPAADTLLLLRPTDSPVLFLQQLGRGLRKTFGKSVCTVLDFVGQHRKEYRIDRRFRALLGGTRRELEVQVHQGFPFLPAGCHMELDPVAADIVLANLKAAVPNQWPAKVAELRAMLAAGTTPTLGAYVGETGLELEDVYANNRCWSDLLAAAGAGDRARDPSEEKLRRGIGRLLHVDDEERLTTWTRLLSADATPTPGELPTRDQRFLRMLVAQVADQAVTKSTTLSQGRELLWSYPQVRAELSELLELLGNRIDRVHQPFDAIGDCPLRVHARYTRVEILAALGIGAAAKVAPWQTGVYWSPENRTDLFAFTLDKTDGGFSPTTRYRDYAISRELIHWESQSVTRADSDTGRRYQRHEAMGTHVLLFARLRTSDRAFWFLGPATYVSHESEQPMAVTWRLHHPLPGDLFATFAAAVA